jgi:MFS family permease
MLTLFRGLVGSHGAYQTYYELNLLAHKSPLAIAWIGSLQSSLPLLMGVFIGPIYDWGYFRALIFVGCFLEVFGIMMLSLCKSYSEVILVQGLVIDVGCGCVFILSIAILPTYFSTKKRLANGIIAQSGSGLGKWKSNQASRNPN